MKLCFETWNLSYTIDFLAIAEYSLNFFDCSIGNIVPPLALYFMNIEFFYL